MKRTFLGDFCELCNELMEPEDVCGEPNCICRKNPKYVHSGSGMKECRCEATMGANRCDLERGHSSMHYFQLPDFINENGWRVSGYSGGWADTVEQVEESGLFAPWLTDALRENEKRGADEENA
jgi:hypothetical protein